MQPMLLLHAMPIQAHGQRRRLVRFQSGVIQRGDACQFLHPPGKKAAITVVLLLLLHNIQPCLLKVPAVRIFIPVLQQQKDRDKIILTITIANSGIPSNPQQPSIRKNTSPDKLPELRYMMIQCFRRPDPFLPVKKVQHSHIGKANHHISHIHIMMMIQCIG